MLAFLATLIQTSLELAPGKKLTPQLRSNLTPPNTELASMVNSKVLSWTAGGDLAMAIDLTGPLVW